MNSKHGWSLPVPELTADWVIDQLAETDIGIFIGFFVYLHSKIPSKADLWNIKSLVATMYSTAYNPLAWIGEWAAWRNGIEYTGYARIPEAPPQDEFYSMIPWAYELLWLQLVYTWEPIWWAVTENLKSNIDKFNEAGPYQKQKEFYKWAFDYDAYCPDVQTRIGAKLEKIMLAIPAWVLYLVFWIVRLFIMLYLALVVSIVWLFDFIFTFVIMIRDFFWNYIIFPIIWFHMFVFNWTVWII